jgi:predicted Rossmann fold nucleotide-binding protein DprA/Smf involved in DNA uptake
VDGLIACPQTLKEEIRSGTWTTVRIARRLGRVIWLVYPNGAIVIEDAKGKKMDHGR